MLTLVMPDCLTASMTVAKAPKGTFSSARTKINCLRGSRIFCRSLLAISLILMASLPKKNALVFVDGDDQSLFRDFLHGASLGHIHLNPRLQHGAVTIK